jgi:hypothetical protein
MTRRNTLESLRQSLRPCVAVLMRRRFPRPKSQKKRADARCCDAGVFAELEFASTSLVAAALALSSLLSGCGEALVRGFAGAGLGAVAAPCLRAVSAALVVPV